jgi:molecular chaperone GrpE
MSKKEQKSLEEEIVYDTDNSNELSGSSDLEKKLKKVKEELKKCQSENREYLDGWQRTKADYVNLKKQSEENRKDFAKYANEEFIMELLPVLDSFDLAFKNKESWEKAPPEWRTGVEFIHTQLQNVLSGNNVQEINPIGMDFDPKEHNSIESVRVESEKDNGKILDVTLKGYKIGEKIIRHPNVKVGEFSDEE